MAADLVAFGVHALDDSGITSLWVVDLALPAVVADDEEGCFDIVRFEDVEQVGSPEIWTVVECESDFARY